MIFAITCVLFLAIAFCSKTKEDTLIVTEKETTLTTESIPETSTEAVISETSVHSTTVTTTVSATVTTLPTTTKPSTTHTTTTASPSSGITSPTAYTTTTLPTTATTIPQFPKPYYDPNAASELLKRTNEERAKHSLAPLTLSSSLTDAAKIRSYEISLRFSHTRPNGKSCDTVYTQDIGENIAYGQTSYDEVFNAWMNSEAHRKNILKEDYTRMGAYCYVESNGRKYWAQLFII